MSSNLNFKKAIALAEHGQIDEAIAQVVQEYTEKPELRDGFSCIAIIFYERGHHEISLQLLEKECLSGRLLPAYRQVYAYLLAKNNKTKESKTEFSRSYSEDPSLRYGYSLVDQLMVEPRFSKKEIGFFDLETATEKLLSLACSLAQQGRYHEAGEKIEEAYSGDANLQGGYAFIGSIHRAFVRYEQALHYYEIDRCLERLTPANRIILANLLARFQRIDEAEDEVSLAYAEDNTIRDGFSLIGSVYRSINKYEEALPYYERDKSLNRLSPPNRHILADQLARAGRLREAENEVLIGYTEDPTLQNGYARIGNIFRVKSEFKKAFQYYERDWKEGRLSPVHRALFAELLTQFGDLEAALIEVKAAYAEDLTLTDGYSRCAWAYYSKNKQYDKIIELCELDKKQGRLSPAGRLMLAEAYAWNGTILEGEMEVANAYRNDTTLRNGYVRIARICCLLCRSEESLALCKKDMELERINDYGRFLIAESQMALGFFDEALPQLFRIKNMPKKGWVIAARLWAKSFQWPLDHRIAYDPVMKSLLDKHTQLADNPDTEASSICEAIADIGVMRERLVTMSQRTGIDLHEQLRTIASKKYADDACSIPFPFLNARLYAISASDLLVLFNEIILSESDRFETASMNPYIIDGGANIGTSIAYFKWLYPESRIVAFEPNPAIFEICKRNIELNEWRHITLHPYALSGANGQLVFHCDRDMPMASTLLNRAEEEGREFYNVTVEARTLDEFIDCPVDFMKLDIEGAECEVITSLKTRMSLVRSGIIEYHHGSSQNSLSTILQMIERYHDYTIKEPFSIRHETGLGCISSRWSRSIFFKQR